MGLYDSYVSISYYFTIYQFVMGEFTLHVIPTLDFGVFNHLKLGEKRRQSLCDLSNQAYLL